MVARQSQQESSQDQKTERATVPGQALTVPRLATPSPYTPLNQLADCTGLVRIEPAKDDNDPIIGTLFEVAFRDKHKFDALSYMWGEGPSQCHITLNNVAFSVGQNLADALRYLRAHAPEACYWIDAICINQNDVPERNRQVRIMHHIYFRAETVVVWLGKKYAEYEATLPGLHRLGRFKPPIEQPKSEPPPDQPHADPPTAQVPDVGLEQRRMAADLYNDEYWKRLWIIQEIGLAKKIKVCFGNSTVEWSLFIHFITMHSFGREGPIRLDRQRKEKCTGSCTVLQLLRDHKDALCQDRKDKVYGLIGLASDASGFVVDYQKTVFQIWTDVMEFMNQHGLFADQDIVSVGDLVKFLLMGTDCNLLEQISGPYVPAEDRDPESFQLRAAVLGFVVHVGPRPHEIVGNLSTVDKWKQQVQLNYKDDADRAHQESDALVRTILDLDEDVLLKKCFDYWSITSWSIRDNEYGDHCEALRENTHFIGRLQALQSEAGRQPENVNSSAEHAPTNDSRLFQMVDRYNGYTPRKMGIASSDARLGDLICWLQWPRRAVVVRPQNQGDYRPHVWKMQVVGTAVITDDLRASCLGRSEHPDWSNNRLKLEVYLDAKAIFILLA
ncbi:hypothetical protein ACJ41O_003576 [Fusarium nematophilum]